MFLLKVIETFWNELYYRLQTGVMDGQKTNLKYKEIGGPITMLVILLVGSIENMGGMETGQ